ncbi:MAG: preprotein translocase subunit SecG [Thermodesulfobacteria bacterium]|nr:preprotein translocase subunit SecG [Thermodesulfobacteriota bacterium]
MFTVLVIVHVIVCLFLIGIVMVNVGKGSEVGAVFSGSQAIFGGAGPGTFLNKVTAVLAVLFFATSLALTYLSAKRTQGSLMEKAPKMEIPAPETAPPVVPTPQTPQTQEIPTPQPQGDTSAIPVPQEQTAPQGEMASPPQNEPPLAPQTQ